MVRPGPVRVLPARAGPAPRSQNGPVSPSSAKTAAASSGVRRRWSSCSRSPYQTLPSRHMVGDRPRRPTRPPAAAAQASTCPAVAGQADGRAGPDHVVPPAGGRDEEVGHVRLGRRRLRVGQQGERPPAAQAGGRDQDRLVEGGHDPEGVPGAAAPPLLLVRGDHEVHRPGRERVGHADPDPVLVQDQHVLVVQASPAGQDLLDPDAGGGGRPRRPSAGGPPPRTPGRRPAGAPAGAGCRRPPRSLPPLCRAGTKSTLDATHGSPGHRAERAATGPPTVGTCTG